jgi:glycosyltransferase involved in cell wall biosynthesis
VTRHFITIGIAAYNEERSIAHCIESIQAACQSLEHKTELIVVACGCTDQTVQRASRSLDTRHSARLITGPDRLSKCAGLNLIAERARGDIIAFIDADLFVHNDALRILTEAFAKDPSVSVAYGRMLPTKGPSRLWTKVGEWTASALHALRSLPDGSGLWLVCGPLFALRRNIWAKLPEGVMSDDVYIGALAQSKGLRISYLPDAIAYGRYPQTLAEYVDQKLRNRIARIQLHALQNDTFRHVPIWISKFGVHKLRWAALRHLPILLIDTLLSAVAFVQWLSGRRPNAFWNEVPSTKLE